MRSILLPLLLLAAPGATALIPATSDAYEGDATVSSSGCSQHVPVRLDVTFASTLGPLGTPTWLALESACADDVLLQAQESGDGGYDLMDVRGEWAGFLGPNAGFPVGNGSFTLWLDLRPAVGGSLEVRGDHLLPVRPPSEPILPRAR